MVIIGLFMLIVNVDVLPTLSVAVIEHVPALNPSTCRATLVVGHMNAGMGSGAESKIELPTQLLSVKVIAFELYGSLSVRPKVNVVGVMVGGAPNSAIPPFWNVTS